MTHRSNQAVASQDQATSQPDLPPPPRRAVAAWAMALAALMVSLALVGFGVWAVRLPLAHFVLSGAFSERGLDADFEVTQLGLGHASLSDLRLGAETAPDLRIAAAELRWSWRGPAPRLESLRLVSPNVRLSLDAQGRVSAGALDGVRSQAAARRPSIPAMRVEIESGAAEIATPFGALNAVFEGAGVLGQDFSGRALIADTTSRAGAYGLERGGARIDISSADSALNARLTSSAEALSWAGTRIEGFTLTASASAPLDLAGIEIDAQWQIARLSGVDVSGERLAGALSGRASMRDNALTPQGWSGQADATAAQWTLGEISLSGALLDARGAGQGEDGRIGWRLNGARFAGGGVVSDQPGAFGAIRLAQAGAISGQASITLNRSRLSPRGQRALRAALPDVGGAPMGPSFARARQTLSAAGSAFAVTIPLQLAGDRAGYRLWLSAPAEARASSGALLRLSALREDAPALVLRWPDLSLAGAVALELSGGGAPETALLLDTATWTQETAFDADGTLTLANWRVADAGIAVDELGVSLSLGTGGGRVELSGPVRITGPLGDGAVRDLAVTLDLALNWDAQGWRAAPSGVACQSVRAETIEAAGFAFANGAFSLCPLNGALIAANARGDLSGGFTIQRLSLAGRMAGPTAQPARLTAASLTGRFHGRPGAAVLDIDAYAPALEIDLAPGRTLDLALRRATAQARVAGGWRVEGAFEQGVLTDPNLPGIVSAIAGTWTAAPEDNKPVIRIAAGEAVLTALPPATSDERLLFNTLRIVEATGELRDGNVTADGAIVLPLERGEQRLARFVALHDVSEGVGDARISTGTLDFGPNLKPYEISEQMRGLVENVRGPANVLADVTWTNSTIAAQGRVRLDGVALATSTIPIVEGVSGEIFFDDLFQLTTPPGQFVTVGLVNPGVAVNNGRVRFQLLTEQRVAIEQAQFDFASGTLAMAPTTITLDADETRFSLTLRDVDAANLLANLAIPDLAVTGRIEGEFPLRLTRRSAFIEDGVLRAQTGGGMIAYTGNAGAGATGAAAIAFDALKSFRYDTLEMTLNGDLSGEVISSIAFSGENSDRAVDLGPIAPIPGIGSVTVRGVPFDFNVRVTAPFRRLAQTVASITDPGAILGNAQDQAPPESVDPAPAPPR